MENDREGRVEEYRAYLKSDVWYRLRAQAMTRCGGLCACGQPAVEVHHVRYPKRFGDEAPVDLVAVCQKCHEIAHGKPQLPELAESRLNICGLAGRALTERQTDKGAKVASRLDGSAQTAEMNTYRRVDVYGVLRELSTKPSDSQLPLGR